MQPAAAGGNLEPGKHGIEYRPWALCGTRLAVFKEGERLLHGPCRQGSGDRSQPHCGPLYAAFLLSEAEKYGLNI